MSDVLKGVESCRNPGKTFSETGREGLHSWPNPARLLSHPGASCALRCIALSSRGLSNGNQSSTLLPKRRVDETGTSFCVVASRPLCVKPWAISSLSALREKVAKNCWKNVIKFVTQFVISIPLTGCFIWLLSLLLLLCHKLRAVQPNPQGAYQSVKLSLGSRSRVKSKEFRLAVAFQALFKPRTALLCCHRASGCCFVGFRPSMQLTTKGSGHCANDAKWKLQQGEERQHRMQVGRRRVPAGRRRQGRQLHRSCRCQEAKARRQLVGAGKQ